MLSQPTPSQGEPRPQERDKCARSQDVLLGSSAHNAVGAVYPGSAALTALRVGFVRQTWSLVTSSWECSAADRLCIENMELCSDAEDEDLDDDDSEVEENDSEMEENDSGDNDTEMEEQDVS